MLDLELIKKYDRPGPRYTSYPTAPHFNENFIETDYLNEIDRSNKMENPPDLSLYAHIPYCDTMCYFCGCNMIATKDRERIGKYTEYLKKELEILRNRLKPDRKVEQLHFGGGTPTHLNPDEIEDISAFINSLFDFTEDTEAGCEIDPRELTKEHLEALRNGGFNRISMGVQDFDEKVQKSVNRIQSEELTLKTIGWIHELGFESLNLDLIYGLPFQTEDTFSGTVDKIIEIDPDRIALFNYAHVPWLKKHQKLIRQEDLPSPEEKLNIMKMTVMKLLDAGYVFIGMDHFAKPQDELAVAMDEKKLYRNFQGYTTHAGADLHALGITGISQLERVYAQSIKTEQEYYAALDEDKLPVFKGYILNRDDIIRRRVIMKLMCSFEVLFEEIEAEFGIDFKKYFKNSFAPLKEMADDGLINLTNDKITVKNPGRFLVRNIAMNFDGFLENTSDNNRYSRTI